MSYDPETSDELPSQIVCKGYPLSNLCWGSGARFSLALLVDVSELSSLLLVPPSLAAWFIT